MIDLIAPHPPNPLTPHLPQSESVLDNKWSIFCGGGTGEQPLCLQSVATGSLLARPFLSPQLQAFEVDCLVRELDMCVPVRSSVFTRYAWLLQVARCDFRIRWELYQCWVFPPLASLSLPLPLALDVVALLWTCFQPAATFVSCADPCRLLLEMHCVT